MCGSDRFSDGIGNQRTWKATLTGLLGQILPHPLSAPNNDIFPGNGLDVVGGVLGNEQGGRGAAETGGGDASCRYSEYLLL